MLIHPHDLSLHFIPIYCKPYVAHNRYGEPIREYTTPVVTLYYRSPELLMVQFLSPTLQSLHKSKLTTFISILRRERENTQQRLTCGVLGVSLRKSWKSSLCLWEPMKWRNSTIFFPYSVRERDSVMSAPVVHLLLFTSVKRHPTFETKSYSLLAARLQWRICLNHHFRLQETQLKRVGQAIKSFLMQVFGFFRRGLNLDWCHSCDLFISYWKKWRFTSLVKNDSSVIVKRWFLTLQKKWSGRASDQIWGLGFQLTHSLETVRTLLIFLLWRWRCLHVDTVFLSLALFL